MAVFLAAERALGVVEVHAAEILHAYLALKYLHYARECLNQ